MMNLRTLVGIAGIGGLVTALTGKYLHNILQKRVLESPVYQEAMAIVNSHPEIDQLLGKPVESSYVDVRNSNNVLSLRLTNLEVPVYGPKNNGVLYITANRRTPEDQWNVYNVELEVQDDLSGKVGLVSRPPAEE